MNALKFFIRLFACLIRDADRRREFRERWLRRVNQYGDREFYRELWRDRREKRRAAPEFRVKFVNYGGAGGDGDFLAVVKTALASRATALTVVKYLPADLEFCSVFGEKIKKSAPRPARVFYTAENIGVNAPSQKWHNWFGDHCLDRADLAFGFDFKTPFTGGGGVICACRCGCAVFFR
ncbi:MAG: hypothetical protein LBP75_11125 [Planctomycetota bacterium]|jgi:hypothetical protein|nr:hypothetical protein [Planctomycetota bacterium]